MNKINTQIVDITFQCVRCETSVTKMCHSDNLKSAMLLCLDCHLTRLGELRKVRK
jgi:hypothetical protein